MLVPIEYHYPYNPNLKTQRNKVIHQLVKKSEEPSSCDSQSCSWNTRFT